MQEESTLEPVEMAEWAALIVPVLKAEKMKVRICSDFRVPVNPVLKLPIWGAFMGKKSKPHFWP